MCVYGNIRYLEQLCCCCHYWWWWWWSVLCCCSIAWHDHSTSRHSTPLHSTCIPSDTGLDFKRIFGATSQNDRAELYRPPGFWFIINLAQSIWNVGACLPVFVTTMHTKAVRGEAHRPTKTKRWFTVCTHRLSRQYYSSENQEMIFTVFFHR